MEFHAFFLGFFNCSFKNILFSPHYISIVFFARKKKFGIQFDISYVHPCVILKGLCCCVVPICFLALESLAQRLTSVVVQQMMCIFPRFSYLTTFQANFHSLSKQVVRFCPLRMGGRVSCPQGRGLCLVVACGR